VELTYRPTEKNRPALEFIRDVARQCGEAAPHPDGPSGQDIDRSSTAGGPPRSSWTFPARLLTRLEYRPAEPPQKEAAAPATDRLPERRAAPSVDFAENVRGRMQRIAEEWRDVKRIVAAMEAPRRHPEPMRLSAELPARGSLEETLADIWRRVLDRPSIAVHDNFFEAGGTSLRAIQVAATIKKELKRTVSIVSLFECPTVSLLAARLSGAPGASRSGASLSQAALRGQRRRSKVVRGRSR
jgi:hypothetical protein